MKLGAQVYSVRNYIQTPDAYGETMKKLKAAGNDTIQHAGPDISDPYLLRDLTQEAGLTQICPNSKLTTVKCLQGMGFDTIAAGDSFNDLAMIQNSKAGFLFRSTEQIKKDYPQYEAFESYNDLLAAIKKVL